MIDECCKTYRQELDALFNHLPSHLPNLRSLSLRGHPQVPFVSDTLHNKLHHLHRLQSFYYDVPTISHNLLLELSKLPTLIRLDLWEAPSIGPHEFEVQRFFPALEILTIRAGGDHAPALLSRITSSQLRDFRVAFVYGGELPNLIPVLAASHYRSLRRCVIEGQGRSNLDWDASILAALYSCGLLEKFEFNLNNVGKPLELLDADLETMAISWPRLKVLRITRNWRGPNLSPIPQIQTQIDYDAATTLHGLRSFAESCVDLVEVMITVNGTIPLVPQNPPSSPSSLRNLHLLDSPCGSVQDLVAFIRHAFPRLYHLDVDTEDRRWQEVMEQLPHTQRWPIPHARTPKEKDGLFD